MQKKPASCFAFLNARVAIVIVSYLFGVVVPLFGPGVFSNESMLAQGTKPGFKAAGTHKISVRDRDLIASLQARGARLIADYGASALLQVSDAVAESVAGDAQIEVVDYDNQIRLNARVINTATEVPRSATVSRGSKQMRLIQFAGPIRPEWYQALVATGVRVVTYIPFNSYLVYGSFERLRAMRSSMDIENIVQWEGPYGVTERVDARVTATPNPGKVASDHVKGQAETPAQPNLSARGNEQFVIQLVDDPDENKITLALIDRLKLEPIISQQKQLGYVNVKVALPRQAMIRQIAERVDVVSIQQWITPKLLGERQDMIMAGNLTGNAPNPGDYLAYLAGKGFDLATPSSFGVNLSDSGLDNGTTTPWQFLLYRLGDPTVPADSRVVYVTAQGNASFDDLPGCQGHGNLNTTIVGGYVPTGNSGGVNFGGFPHADASGFRWGLGVAPFVKVGVSVFFNTNGFFTNPSYANSESEAYQEGMRISSNSWGPPAGGAYNADAQAYDALVRDAQPAGSTFPTDGNQEYTIVFSAGNSGSGTNTISSPGTAKNVITVGAAENVSPFGGSDACGVGDTQADSANDIISFSSRGPCDDGRIKPDIMGPGTHISGGAPQDAANPSRTGTGSHLACFAAAGICGGPAGSNFFPVGQEWYTASSGTSHSCAAVAGTFALYRQYFINHGQSPPSPALNKALMVNAARYLNGVGANDTLPSNSQGYGEANLNSFFDTFAGPHIYRDENHLFTASGQQRTIAGTVADSSKPFRVTLAWTDPPGPTAGDAFINNLDLEVSVGGNTYKGNVFTGANSTTGGTADPRNNVESVFLPAGSSGNFVIKITATNIAGDGVPGNANPLDQDYALVASNASEIPAAVISANSSILITESCSPSNNVVDPGETMTVSFCVENVGNANAVNVVGTLQASGGVINPSAPQTYGSIAAGRGAVCRSFTFTADSSLPCGQDLVASIHFVDGATDLGTVNYPFPSGSLVASFNENFDGVAAPALPAGWTTDQGTNAGGSPMFATSSSGLPAPPAISSPNAAYTIDADNILDNRIYTPSLTYPAGSQLTFRQNIDLEEQSGTSAYDAGVLEISINGAAYADIVTAGGSFVSGGYNHPGINTGFGNPLLPSRPCWSGNSGGFITTVVNLPAAGAGQPVKLRWRMGSDDSDSRTGWRIDNVGITRRVCLTTCSAPAATSAVSRKTHGGAGSFDVALPLSGAPGVECRAGGATNDYTMVVTFGAAVSVNGAPQANVASGSATIGSGGVANGGAVSVSGNVVMIPLTNVSNAQTILVSLNGVTDGSSTGNRVIPMSRLLGDTNGNGIVNASDASQTKSRIGQPVAVGNFRSDINVNGAINATDASQVKSNIGNGLP